MSKGNNGGAAFPVAAFQMDHAKPEPVTWPETGMTLRDYFAAQIITGLIPIYCGKETGPFVQTEWLARWSYDLADAMLAEREK